MNFLTDEQLDEYVARRVAIETGEMREMFMNLSQEHQWVLEQLRQMHEAVGKLRSEIPLRQNVMAEYEQYARMKHKPPRW